MSTDSSSSEQLAPESRAKRMLVFGHVIATVLSGALLYVAPPIAASVMLIVGISLSGMSEGSATGLLSGQPFGQFIYILTTEILVLALLLWFMKLAGENWRSIGIAWPKLKAISYTIAGIGVYYAVFITTVLVASLLVPSLDLSQEQEIGFDRTSRDGMLWAFLSLVILAPLAEELVFRGYLYTRFRRVLSYAWSMFIVSALFGVMHLQFGTGNPLLWVAAIDTFILSLVLVYQREKTGDIWASVFTHALKNFFAFYLIFIRGVA